MSETTPAPREAVLVVNAKSRKGRHLFRRACRQLKAAGVKVTAAHGVRDPCKLNGIMEEAVASGAPMVIVGGGDGTLSCAVDHLVGTRTVFAVLPLGTANSFARTLGLPLDLDGAVAAIAGGKLKRIDLGMIDDDYFANCAAIGISPEVARTVPHDLKKWLGRAGYLGWAAHKLAGFEAFDLTVDDGSGPKTVRAVEVRIANGPYHGGTELVDEARVDSGEIVVQAVLGRGRLALLRNWGASVLGLESRHRQTVEFRGRSLRVSTRPPLPISIDGEVLAETPVTAKVASKVIDVVVPG